MTEDGPPVQQSKGTKRKQSSPSLPSSAASDSRSQQQQQQVASKAPVLTLAALKVEIKRRVRDLESELLELVDNCKTPPTSGKKEVKKQRTPRSDGSGEGKQAGDDAPAAKKRRVTSKKKNPDDLEAEGVVEIDLEGNRVRLKWKDLDVEKSTWEPLQKWLAWGPVQDALDDKATEESNLAAALAISSASSASTAKTGSTTTATVSAAGFTATEIEQRNKILASSASSPGMSLL
jgi:hypothetical protein